VRKEIKQRTSFICQMDVASTRTSTSTFETVDLLEY